MSERENYPRVGVGVMVFKEGKILAGKRKGSRGEGEYQWPGGHLEYGESIEDCARREVLEETGLEIENVRFQFASNVLKYMPKHYLHLGVTADWKSGEPKVLEPEKCEGWDWYPLDNLPEPLFETCRQHLKSLDTKEVFFDSSKNE